MTSYLMSQTRKVRSFVLRQGRMTEGQRLGFERYWSVYGLEPEGPLAIDSLFQEQQPVTLEIGFGNGHSFVEMAAAEPNRNFMGIEVHSPGVGQALRLSGERELTNVKIIRDDAVEILKHCIPDKSLDCIQLFFPDPWHKKRHFKRRIVQSDFVDLLADKLSSGGRFHIATDWLPYAEWVVKVMKEKPRFTNMAKEGVYCERPASRPLTKFEQRGIKKGHGVYDLYM